MRCERTTAYAGWGRRCNDGRKTAGERQQFNHYTDAGQSKQCLEAKLTRSCAVRVRRNRRSKIRSTTLS